MNFLEQEDIDLLDDWASIYDYEVLLPPVYESKHICLLPKETTDFTHLFEALFYEGFSFVVKAIEDKTYIEILGIHYEEI